MSEHSAERARQLRAEQRRASWPPGEVTRPTSAKPALDAEATIEERVARAWALTQRVWLFAGNREAHTERSKLPGEVFDIRAERKRAAG